jgi:hypothetical protein
MSHKISGGHPLIREHLGQTLERVEPGRSQDRQS